MQVSRAGESYTLVDNSGEPISPVTGFLGCLRARRCSPNTQAAYAYDLAHFFRFLDVEQIRHQEFTPARALLLLTYLRELPNRSRARRLRLVPVVVPGQGRAAPGLVSPPVAAVCWRAPGVARRGEAAQQLTLAGGARPEDQSRRGRSLQPLGFEPAIVSDRLPTHSVELRARRGSCRLAHWTRASQ